MSISTYLCKKCGTYVTGKENKASYAKQPCPSGGNHTMVKNEDIAYWVCSKCGSNGTPQGPGGCKNGKNHSWRAIKR